MTAGPKSTIQDRVRALVEELLARNATIVAVTPDVRLADIGLASMDMVNLMLGVEAAFDLTIPQAEITPENFQTVRSIAGLVLRQQRTSAAA